MPSPDASLSGSFAIGGDLKVNRLGFGAMRITGKGIWGEPADPDEARRVLRRLKALNVDFVDTAESYGPEVSERLIGDEIAPDSGIVVATKSGLTRTGPDEWHQLGRPEFLAQGVRMSLRRLKVERIDLWQLHRIDRKVPRDEQFDAIRGFLKDGLIRHAGLSEVGVEEIEAAQKFFPVATVQNMYSIGNRRHEAVLSHCEKHNIGFIPWAPLGGGRTSDVVADVARAHGATPGQISLAWLLKRSPVMLPIPGTGKVAHLEENVASAAIQLSDEEFSRLAGSGR